MRGIWSKRSRTSGLAIGVVAAMSLAACGGGDDDATDTPAPDTTPTAGSDAPSGTDAPSNPGGDPATGGLTPEGTLRVTRTLTWPPTFNPHFDNDAPNLGLFNWVYESLFRLDPSGEFVPWLAESYEFADDYLSLTLHLQEGVTFSNGEPFNAEAAKASLEFVIAGDTDQVLPSVKNQLENVASVEAVDETTLVINYEEPRPIESIIWLAKNAGMMVAPSSLGKADQEPVGTGPFTIDVAASSADHTFVALDYNPNYWQQGVIGFERVEFTNIPDQTAARQALDSGQFDIGFGNLEFGPPQNGYDAMGSGVPHYHYAIVDWQGKQIPALANRDVRCAIAQTVNRDDIAAIWNMPQEQFLSQFARTPDDYAWIDDYSVPQFDMEAAKALFESTGESGFAFETRSFPGQTADIHTAWSQNLAQLGITMNHSILDPVSGAQMFKNFSEGAFPIQWLPFEPANPLMTLKLLAMPDGGLNPSKAAPEGLEELVHQAEVLPLDEAEPLIEQALKIMYDECIWIPLWQDFGGLAVNNDIRGVVRVGGMPTAFYPQGVYRES